MTLLSTQIDFPHLEDVTSKSWNRESGERYEAFTMTSRAATEATLTARNPPAVLLPGAQVLHDKEVVQHDGLQQRR